MSPFIQRAEKVRSTGSGCALHGGCSCKRRMMHGGQARSRTACDTLMRFIAYVTHSRARQTLHILSSDPVVDGQSPRYAYHDS